MNIKIKFYFYLLITIILSPLLVSEIMLVYQNAYRVDVVLLLLILLVYLILYLAIRKDFLLPFDNLQNWMNDYHLDQSARLDEKQKTSFQPLATAINHLIEENQHLYDDMESILNKQIHRLSKKSASLETLYSVSSELNKVHSTEQLFEHFLDVFINMTGACSGVARSLNDEGELHLTAQRGTIDAKDQIPNVLSSDCICGEVAMAKEMRVQFSVHTCAKCVGKKTQTKSNVGTIFIPLRFHGRTLGIFNLFFDTEPSLAFDERALLESIADNIAVALDKARLDAEAKRMALSQERLFLSQEIHDSLAQTIYSLKLQMTVLGDMLKKDAQVDASEKIVNLQANITQANQELRELMHNFRVPLDSRGIEASLSNLADQFKNESGVATYLQIQDKPKFLPEVEMQIMRITQEALSNVRKHAKARNVRILLTSNPYRQLLIEDDGIGFKKEPFDAQAMGNNIGMNIMQERANSVGANIEIESEIGEGTRVVLTFKNSI